MASQPPATEISFAYVYHRQVIAAGAILPAAGIIVVTLRFWTRLKHHMGLGTDDWLILPALVRKMCSQTKGTS